MSKIIFVALSAALAGGMFQAQNLGLQGETGVFITPLAYTVSSPANGLGLPVLGFHFLDASVATPPGWQQVRRRSRGPAPTEAAQLAS